MVTSSEFNSKVGALSEELQATQEGVATWKSDVAMLKSDGATLKSSIAAGVNDVLEIKTSLDRLASVVMGKNPVGEGFAQEFGTLNIPGSFSKKPQQVMTQVLPPQWPHRLQEDQRLLDVDRDAKLEFGDFHGSNDAEVLLGWLHGLKSSD